MNAKELNKIESMPKKITVVTVTYGNREHYVKQLLSSLSANKYVGNIVIVNNGSASNYAHISEQMGLINVDVINLNKNLGSAVGFFEGLSRAIDLNNEYVWLLDDDNCPNDLTIEYLINAKICFPDAILVSNRVNRLEYMNLIYFGKKRKEYNNSFMGFHFYRRFISYFSPKQYMQGATTSPINYPIVRLDTAPYGGSFLDKSQIKLLGYPLKDMVLYFDDHEYFGRAKSKGLSIYLIGLSLLDELEESWDRKKNISDGHYMFSKSSLDAKIYYSVRNKIFLQKTNGECFGLIYYLNALIYLSGSLVISLIRESLSIRHVKNRCLLIFRAIKDGVNCNLGENLKL